MQQTKSQPLRSTTAEAGANHISVCRCTCSVLLITSRSLRDAFEHTEGELPEAPCMAIATRSAAGQRSPFSHPVAPLLEIRLPVIGMVTIEDDVARHPVVGVEGPLCGNGMDAALPGQVNLEPRMLVVGVRRPAANPCTTGRAGGAEVWHTSLALQKHACWPPSPGLSHLSFRHNSPRPQPSWKQTLNCFPLVGSGLRQLCTTPCQINKARTSLSKRN